MTADNLIVLGILAGAVILFVTERLSIDLVAMLVVAALILTGLLTPEDAFSGFRQPCRDHGVVSIHCQWRIGEHRRCRLHRESNIAVGREQSSASDGCHDASSWRDVRLYEQHRGRRDPDASRHHRSARD